jgi:hypothetical protein
MRCLKLQKPDRLNTQVLTYQLCVNVRKQRLSLSLFE